MDKEGWKGKVSDMIWALHGAVGMADDWKGFSAQMAACGHLTRRVDLWRFLACCPMSLKEFGKAFNEEVRRVDDNPILLGYSMGGRLALHALLDDPALWKGAVILSAHTGLAKQDRRARRMRDTEWAAKALEGDWSSFLTDWNSQGVLKSTLEDSLPEGLVNRQALRPRRQQVARSFMDWSTGVQEDLRDEMQTLSIPVMWMVGELDDKFVSIGREAVNLLPSAELVCLEGCGHRVPWEQSEAFSENVSAWIHRISMTS